MSDKPNTFGEVEVDLLERAIDTKIKVVADIQNELILHFRYILDVIEEEVQESDEVELAFVWYGVDIYKGAILFTGVMSPDIGQTVVFEDEPVIVTEDLIPRLAQRLFFTVRADKLAECQDVPAVQRLVRSALKMSQGKAWNSETGAIEDEAPKKSTSSIFEKYDTVEEMVAAIPRERPVNEFDVESLTDKQRQALELYNATPHQPVKKGKLC